MSRPEIPFEGDAVETLLSLANYFPEGLEFSRVSPHPGITGSETSAGVALAQARYQLLIDQLPAATFMAWFENGRCELYVSSYIETLLGYTAKEWTENSILWYERLHPDDRQRAGTRNSHEQFHPPSHSGATIGFYPGTAALSGFMEK